MKAKTLALLCALVAVVVLGCVCVRQWQRLAQAKADPFALQNYDTRIDLAVNKPDDMTWVVSSTAAGRGYALFVGEFRGCKDPTPRGRPHVYAMLLPAETGGPGFRPERFRASVLQVERVGKFTDGREENVAYKLNGREVIRFDKPITGRVGMSHRPHYDFRLADELRESIVYDVIHGADSNQQDDFLFSWELHICNKQALKRYVDSGDLREVWEGNAAFPASRLFPAEPQGVSPPRQSGP